MVAHNHHADMDEPFLGPRAVAEGTLTRGQLRWRYSAVVPRVYAIKDVELSLASRIEAVSLWAGDGAVIAGSAAAFLHGVSWVENKLDKKMPIEVITPGRRRWPGVIARQERIAADEIVEIEGVAVTSAVRTAYDLARHRARYPAVAALDGLTGVSGVTEAEVLALAERYPGARGIRRARIALDLMDPGAQSPPESRLRLMFIDAGYPRPRTQIRLTDGHSVAYLDMGWDEPKVGVDYDGEYHQLERGRYVSDIGRAELVQRLGWTDIHVVKEHGRAYILHRTRQAWLDHGYTR